jgi:hypothetical protein
VIDGLVAVNDGHFRSEDGRAIRRFGLNSKAADAASIGKFGLGLISVFHLAESGLHPDWDDWPIR